MIEYNNGIHILGTPLWLDSQDPQELCYISHGHIDHLGRHETIIATQPTVDIYERRMRATESIVLTYQEKRHIDSLTVALYPAGHILGSAQILIEKDDKRILYSGDINLRDNLTAEKIVIPQADILIMEATYGRPEDIFPHRDMVIADLIKKIDTCLADEVVPVLGAYSLGKGQEIAKILGDRGYSLLLHNTIFDLLDIYQAHGITFQGCEKYHQESTMQGKVLIFPPYVLESEVVSNIQKKKICMLSGWEGMKGDKKENDRIMIPLSDHADFNELIDYVKAVNPTQVYITHGREEFAETLTQIGVRGQVLT